MDVPMYPTLDKCNLPPYATIPEEQQECKKDASGKNYSLLTNSWDQVDPELGVTPEEERSRSEGLATMFNMNHYSRETYHKAFFAVMVRL